jgi:hypothetical protein
MNGRVAGVVFCLLLLLSGDVAVWAQQPTNLDAALAQGDDCGDGVPGAVEFVLAATGDTFPHENIQAVGEAQGYDVLFEHVRPFLRAADVGYTNLDGAMLAGAGYTGYPLFNFNPQLATALRNAGVTLVSTANNHILDRGPAGLDATLGVLDANGIAHHGAVRSDAQGVHTPFLPFTLRRDGASIRVAFLSFTWGTNGIPDPYGQVNLLWESNAYGSQGGIRQSVLDAVAAARQASDVVIVAAHWGYEYQFYPDAVQVAGAQALTAAGADVILGTQSHTLQPVDWVEAGGRRALVFYSLANFLASQGPLQAEYWSATSAIVYVGVLREPSGAVRVSGYRYLPTIHIDDDTRPAPVPAAGMDDVIARVRLKMRDPAGLRQISPDPAALGTRVAICPQVALAPTPSALSVAQPITNAVAIRIPARQAQPAPAPALPAWPLVLLVVGGLLGGLVYAVIRDERRHRARYRKRAALRARRRRSQVVSADELLARLLDEPPRP